MDRGEPDTLRRDFLEGGAEVFFVLYLPRGKYDVLLICGDEQDVSCTRAALPGHGTHGKTGSRALWVPGSAGDASKGRRIEDKYRYAGRVSMEIKCHVCESGIWFVRIRGDSSADG